MYLSSLEIDVSTTGGRAWLGNPYRVHQRLLMGFPDGQAGRVLFRIEATRETPRILVQSPIPPDWVKGFFDLPVLCNASVKQFGVSFDANTRVRFLLLANPTRRSVQHIDERDGGRRIGKRIGIVREEEQIEWLRRKGEVGGFALEHIVVRPRGEARVMRTETDPMCRTLRMVEFEGELTVVDGNLFVETVANGIGTAKAFGFGLLSVARA